MSQRRFASVAKGHPKFVERSRSHGADLDCSCCTHNYNYNLGFDLGNILGFHHTTSLGSLSPSTAGPHTNSNQTERKVPG